MSDPDRRPRAARVELDESNVEYMRAKAFGDFFKNLIEVRNTAAVIQHDTGFDTSQITDSFWTFGSSQTALESVPGSDSRIARLREDLRAALHSAGDYYQAFERQYGADALRELRAICDELSTVEQNLATLCDQPDVPFASDDVKTVFSEGVHLRGQTKKDAIAAAKQLGHPFKSEMRKILELRKRFDILVTEQSNG